MTTTHVPAPTRFLLVRAVVTLMILLALGASLRLSTYRLPFRMENEARFSTISPLPDLGLPAGLETGDRIVYMDQSARVRALLAAPNVLPGTAYPFLVHRAGRDLAVSIETVPAPDDGMFLSTVNLLTVFVISLLGLLTLWRGNAWSAWGLTLFTTGVLCGSALVQTPAIPYGAIALTIAGFFLTGPVPFLGLYMTALDLTGRRPRARPRLTALFAAALTGLFGSDVLHLAAMLFYGRGGAIWILDLLSGCFAVTMVAVPLVVLTSGYVAARADQKLRIRWVLASTAMLIPLLVTSVIDQWHLSASDGVNRVVAILHAVLTALIFSLYAYAVLRQRLVDVRFAINRTLVFAALMMLVVGALGVTENLIERSALGESAGLVLEFGVPLALGAVFHRLHRWIEATVDRLVFRHEHQSRAALADFVRDAGFIENADTLVGRMVSTFARHAGGHGAALFELRGAGMECSVQDGDGRWPDLIETDDPGLVRLRATLGPLDLHGVESALGEDGLAMPLALRGRIFGVLVCGPRAAGRYAQAEASELGQAARDVGASLFALRARANELLIERLAQGQIQADRAIGEARRLAGLV